MLVWGALTHSAHRLGLEWRLGSVPCTDAKLIYYTSIKRRELHCSCQLLFCRRYLRASLQCSACLHTCSTCCQNQLSPSRSANRALSVAERHLWARFDERECKDTTIFAHFQIFPNFSSRLNLFFTLYILFSLFYTPISLWRVGCWLTKNHCIVFYVYCRGWLLLVEL